MRKPIIAGNWKMFKTAGQAVFLVQNIEPLIDGVKDVEVVICPPFVALNSVSVVLEQDKPPVALGAQNMHWEEEGAFTGEISPTMLLDLGVKYVIIGHSERRQMFCETDETVNKKVKSALAHGLIPIMCCGETLQQREANQVGDVIGGQVASGLAGLTAEDVAGLVIAYEPIWAIGTGRTATPAQANDTCALVRETVRQSFGDAADAVRVLYGGSVKPDNVDSLMATSDIDGALVGGACLDPQSFARIIRFKA